MGASDPASQRSRLIPLGEARALLPGPAGEHSASVFRRGPVDVVVRGRGVLFHDGRRDRFEAGDCMFVAAGVEHRFEDYSDDLAEWVVFHGPPGGEVPAP